MERNRMQKKRIFCCVSIGLFLTFIVSCGGGGVVDGSPPNVASTPAGSATISWSASSDPEVAGHNIYYGKTSRTGNDPKECGMCGYTEKVDASSRNSYIIINPIQGTICFSVTAYDANRIEGTFSNEHCQTIQ